MSKVAIVFWSGTGNTAAMVKLVEEGARGAGADVDVFTASEFTPAKAEEYDLLAFGCPSMGSEVLEEDEFAPMFSAVKSGLGGKRIALFGSYGWGDGQWMRDWAEECKFSGCVMAAEPVIANEYPDDIAADACRALGTALAEA